jgi:hypothetical protein
MSRLKSVDFYKKIPRYMWSHVHVLSTAPLLVASMSVGRGSLPAFSAVRAALDPQLGARLMLSLFNIRL